MNSNADADTSSVVVDDIELLAILGLTSPSPCSSLCNNENEDSMAVLDWDDMPELSEDEDASTDTVVKRKYDEEDLFAEFDFIEVTLLPEQKKQKTLLIQEPFVSQDQMEEDIRLALDLVSSST
ncbi:hypothetical protein INT47_006555 [Mucor saturninus]|uniref:Uncharacterized protein n=1 Tax=Mucor saturninus TaxID=64648 RepID=A0A8H7QYD7_9FUNG|nr:hypothetical protein INT47_006555 [Mucor saturninus]